MSGDSNRIGGVEHALGFRQRSIPGAPIVVHIDHVRSTRLFHIHGGRLCSLLVVVKMMMIMVAFLVVVNFFFVEDQLVGINVTFEYRLAVCIRMLLLLLLLSADYLHRLGGIESLLAHSVERSKRC